MRDDYICVNCGEIESYDKPYGEEFPKQLTCKKCGGVAKRSLAKNIVIPEHMRSALGFKY